MTDRLTAEREAEIRREIAADNWPDPMAVPGHYYDYRLLLAELDAVRAERDTMQDALTRIGCPDCGGPVSASHYLNDECSGPPPDPVRTWIEGLTDEDAGALADTMYKIKTFRTGPHKVRATLLSALDRANKGEV